MVDQLLNNLSYNMSMLKFILTTIISIAFIFQPPSVLAQTTDWEPDLCVIEDVATIQGIMCLIGNVLSVALTAIGITGFIMMVVGSIRWIMAGSNAQNVDKARSTMTYAVVGLVLALCSFMIIKIIADFTGIDIITKFFIPTSDTGVSNPSDWDNI